MGIDPYGNFGFEKFLLKKPGADILNEQRTIKEESFVREKV